MTDPSEFIWALIASGGIAAAVLAWVATIRWSRECRVTREGIVKSGDAHIASLEREVKLRRDLSRPTRIEHTRAVISALEDKIDSLNEQLALARVARQRLERPHGVPALAGTSTREHRETQLARRIEELQAATETLGAELLGRGIARRKTHLRSRPPERELPSMPSSVVTRPSAPGKRAHPVHR